ncbi:MAG: hypothetical protein R2800_08435 [Flavipsychrobacter sp.]
MNKFFYLLIVLLGYSALAHADNKNYELREATPTNVKISKDVDLFNVAYKYWQNWLYVFVKEKKEKSAFINIYKINAKTGMLDSRDTVKVSEEYFSIGDILIDDNYILLTSADEYVLVKDRKSTYSNFNELKEKQGALNYKHAEKLNDSLVLLYRIYNFHPNDGNSGLHLTLFNVNTQKVEKTRLIDFPSIILSHMNKRWLTVSGDKILYVTPLTGKLYAYDFNLNFVSVKELKLNKQDFLRNDVLEKTYDSLHSAETYMLRNKIKLESPIYTKDFIGTVINDVRSKEMFIEKIFPIDNSVIGISISNPKTSKHYRDVYVYDVKRDKLVSKNTDWLSWRQDKVSSHNDYYPISINSSPVYAPFFHKRNIYSCTLFYTKTITPSSSDEISMRILKDINENDYQVTILKYKRK